MTVDMLVRRLSTSEMTDWIAFYTLEHEERERQRRIAESKANMRRSR